MTTMFIQPEIVHAEAAARRERLAHDWQQQPRRARRAHRLQISLRSRTRSAGSGRPVPCPMAAPTNVTMSSGFTFLPVRTGRHA